MNPRPNILLIMTDQHRFECLGCHGNPVVKTPNIDRLAASGIDFWRAYSQSAICMPSRVSMLTGQYIHSTGIRHNTRRVDVSHLPTLPQKLKVAGYKTGAVGKTHAGPSVEMGFDHVRIAAGAAEGEANDYKDYLEAQGIVEPEPDQAMKAFDAYSSVIPYKHTREAWTGNEGLRFLEGTKSEEPFFLWLSFDRPHAPTCVPADNPFPYDPDTIVLPPWSETFYTKPGTRRPGCEASWNVLQNGEPTLRQAIANYYTLISMIDDQIGRVLAHLEHSGQLENTIVIFTSDHGEFAGEFGQFGKNTSTFDVLYRIPFIWNWPGHTGREQTHELVELIDLMPTLLEAAGVETPRTVQGQSLLNAILGSHGRCGIPWDGKEAVFFETPFVKTVRTRTHKLSLCYKGKTQWGQLYDLAADPAEQRNLYGNPACAWIETPLKDRLLQWLVETQQPQVHGCGLDETTPDIRWFQHTP